MKTKKTNNHVLLCMFWAWMLQTEWSKLIHRGGSSQASEFASQVTVECNSYHIKVVP